MTPTKIPSWELRLRKALQNDSGKVQVNRSDLDRAIQALDELDHERARADKLYDLYIKADEMNRKLAPSAEDMEANRIIVSAAMKIVDRAAQKNRRSKP